MQTELNETALKVKASKIKVSLSFVQNLLGKARTRRLMEDGTLVGDKRDSKKQNSRHDFNLYQVLMLVDIC